MTSQRLRTVIFAVLIPVGVVAADFGSAMLLYQQGNYAAAQQEFLVLANQGDPEAQFILGDIYANGQGVPTDVVQAYRWYTLAAKNRAKGAAKVRDQLAAKMTPGQIEQGEQLAGSPPATTTPAPANAPANPVAPAAPPPPPPPAPPADTAGTSPSPPPPPSGDNFFARLSRGTTGLLGSHSRAPDTNQGVTPSLGIRGLSAEDLRTATPNPQALQQMEGYQSNPGEAASFAQMAQLSAQNVPYLQTAPETPANAPSHNPLMH
ncbi:MAG TPA: hypothetical protein VMH34_04380 [Gammaproteobacteria bacterium]|nr:hypothetical protein [Gammaproteobacteria bacterium]